ncbi:mechanosensitive ion channel family protein [Ligilactobacillus ceti]|nr:mechanosensitive ion channel family protein [Ligilactobacillus ceti]
MGNYLLTKVVTNENFSQFSNYFNLDRIFRYVQEHSIRAIIALLIIIFFSKIRNLFKLIFEKIFKNFLANTPAIASFLLSMISVVIDLVLILVIFKLLGINLSGITAMVGAFSLVLGFAFKDILANFFGGLILLTFCPIKAEDVIKYNDFEGVVKKIEIFYTTLVDFQNSEIIIPNARLISNEVVNVKDNAHRRLILQVGVGYDSDIKQVKDTIREIIEKRRDDLFFIDDTDPVIGMYEIGASSLIFEIRVFVREKKFMFARYYLNEAMKTEFDKLGIDLPFDITHLEIDQKLNQIKVVQDTTQTSDK